MNYLINKFNFYISAEAFNQDLSGWDVFNLMMVKHLGPNQNQFSQTVLSRTKIKLYTNYINILYINIIIFKKYLA